MAEFIKCDDPECPVHRDNQREIRRNAKHLMRPHCHAKGPARRKALGSIVPAERRFGLAPVADPLNPAAIFRQIAVMAGDPTADLRGSIVQISEQAAELFEEERKVRGKP